jgi:hypothetical protein
MSTKAGPLTSTIQTTLIDDEPWADEIPQGSDPIDAARGRWRTAIHPLIEAFHESWRRPTFINIDNARKSGAVIRAVSLNDPSLVGDKESVSRMDSGGDISYIQSAAFRKTQCSTQDREEILYWLGRVTARINWRKKGPKSSPLVSYNAAHLMRHWNSILWRNKDLPPWAAGTILGDVHYTYPISSGEEVYRNAEETKADLHTFLTGWKTERSCLGRGLPRRGFDHEKFMREIEIISENMLLLRTLAVCYPGSIEDEDVVTMKSMGYILNSRPVKPEMARILQSMEDREFLEKGLQKNADISQSTYVGSRRRTI